jgi:hypothetical protein
MDVDGVQERREPEARQTACSVNRSSQSSSKMTEGNEFYINSTTVATVASNIMTAKDDEGSLFGHSDDQGCYLLVQQA